MVPFCDENLQSSAFDLGIDYYLSPRARLITAERSAVFFIFLHRCKTTRSFLKSWVVNPTARRNWLKRPKDSPIFSLFPESHRKFRASSERRRKTRNRKPPQKIRIKNFQNRATFLFYTVSLAAVELVDLTAAVASTISTATNDIPLQALSLLCGKACYRARNCFAKRDRATSRRVAEKGSLGGGVVRLTVAAGNLLIELG